MLRAVIGDRSVNACDPYAYPDVEPVLGFDMLTSLTGALTSLAEHFETLGLTPHTSPR